MAHGYRYLTQDELTRYGFAEIGEDVQVHELANIVGAEWICLGSHVRIDGFINLVAQQRLEIGSHVHIASFCHISASRTIRIGDYAGLSQGVCLYTASDDYSGRSLTNPTVDPALADRDEGPIVIADHVIIGAQTVVLPGISIGEGAAVGALSLVNRDLEPWTIHGGVPARPLKPRSRGLLDRLADSGT